MLLYALLFFNKWAAKLQKNPTPHQNFLTELGCRKTNLQFVCIKIDNIHFIEIQTPGKGVWENF